MQKQTRQTMSDMAITKNTQQNTYQALTSWNIARLMILLCLIGMTIFPARPHMQEVTDPVVNDLPNPNPTILTSWGVLPDGRDWGSTAGVDIDPDGHETRGAR